MASRSPMLAILLGLFSAQAFAAESPPLDRGLQPEAGSGVPSVFRDMGVVQRKAMNKSEKLLISNYLSMDFSDGPFAMYGVNVDLGYALSDFWEIYINTVPYFINSKRSIVDR